MHKYKIFAIVLLCFLAFGCQLTQKKVPLNPESNQTSNITENKIDSKPQESSSDKVSSETLKISNSDPVEVNEDPDANSIVDIPEQPIAEQTIKEEPSEQQKVANEKNLVQEKIDYALEMCQLAQQMWEKGKLEEALSNLDAAYLAILEINLEPFPEFNQQKEDLRYLISKRILEIYASRQIVVNGLHNEIPRINNEYVQKEIKRLTGPERKFFIESLKRSGRFRPYIIEELRKAGLPESLSWLPLIESGFKVRALSKARALGLWQFIPSTGYKFGLNRNYYVDERLDPEKATKAAIAYLKELHNLFGDWTTVLAAYNCGEGRVLKKIRRQKINYLDNFWDLYQSLPRETARYVPRFLAALHIVENLSEYGIEITDELEPIEYKICKIKKQILLKDIAKEIGEDADVLKQLNPELRYALLPPETYEVRIPVEKAELFIAKLDKIKATYAPPSRFVYHRIRKGDTLSGIAKKYHTSIHSITAVNRVYKGHKIIAGKVLKVPTKNFAPKRKLTKKTALAPGQKLNYIVKQGDNLWIIARKFNTTTKNIMAVNGLNKTFLHIGQALVISSEKQNSTVDTTGAATYWVKTGDSPFSIAKKHNMSLNHLLALNQLNKRSKIFPGQKLYIK